MSRFNPPFVRCLTPHVTVVYYQIVDNSIVQPTFQVPEKYKHLVTKHNALINASYRLDLGEQRLILLAISESRRTGRGLTTSDPVVVHASAYADMFDVDIDTAYQVLKGAAEQLFERQFKYIEPAKRGVKVVQSRWVSKIVYIENEANVHIIFAPDVVGFISELEKNFTTYQLEKVSELDSRYAVRIYEIVSSWKSVGKSNKITVEELRDRLGMTEEDYPRLDTFKRRVLDYCISEINKKTDLIVSYEQHKCGRRIESFTFHVEEKKVKPKVEKVKQTRQRKPKQKKEAEPEIIKSDIPQAIPLTIKQRAMFASKLAQLPQCNHLPGSNQSYEALAAFIAGDLQKPERAEFYLPLLYVLGYED